MPNIVEFVDVRSEMAHDGPASTISLECRNEKRVGMHVRAFTDINFILILNKSTKNFEESRNISKLRTNFKILIIQQRIHIIPSIYIHPFFTIFINNFRNKILNLKIYNTIII